MTKNRITLYLAILSLLCIVSVLLMLVYNFNLASFNPPLPVMVTFTVPAFFCILSLLCTNGFRNFRLDVVGVVGSGILVLTFGILTFFIYVRFSDVDRSASSLERVITLAVCSFIGILPMVALHDTLRKNKQYVKEHGQQQGRFRRAMQYATWMAATSLILLPFSTPHSVCDCRMFIDCSQYGAGLLGVYVLFVGLSLSFMLIILLTSWLWKQAKVASVLSATLFVPIVIIVVLLYLDITSIEACNNITYSHYMNEPGGIEIDTYYDNEAYDGEEYDGEEYYGEEYDGEEYDDEEGDEVYKPIFIGNDILGTEHSMDEEWRELDSIYMAVRYFVGHMELGEDPYYFPSFQPPGLLPYKKNCTWNANTQIPGSHAYDGLIRLLWRNRKVKVIEDVFDLYSDLVKSAMSKVEYQDSGYELVVRQLISAYQDMEKTSSSFSIIYRIMKQHVYDEEGYKLDLYEYYDFIEDYVSAGSHQLIFREQNEGEDEETYNSEIEYAKCRAVWLYSFWGRRDNEGIRETVYRTLVKLNAMYH